MSKELSEETKYEFNVFARQLNKDLTNLMEYLRQQDKDNKPILYVGRHLKKVILPYDEYQKMCQRLESIDNSNPSEALESVDYIENKLGHLRYECKRTNNHRCDDLFIQEHIFNNIKQALLKAQEQEKVLEIIKEKKVNIYFISTISTYDEYLNADACFQPNIVDYMGNYHKEQLLTPEEFDLLKRYFK